MFSLTRPLLYFTWQPYSHPRRARLPSGPRGRAPRPAGPAVAPTTHQDSFVREVLQLAVPRGVKDHREGFVRRLDVAQLHLVLQTRGTPAVDSQQLAALDWHSGLWGRLHSASRLLYPLRTEAGRGRDTCWLEKGLEVQVGGLLTWGHRARRVRNE